MAVIFTVLMNVTVVNILKMSQYPSPDYLKCPGDLDLEGIVKKQLIFSAFSQRVTTDGGGSVELHNRCYPSEPRRQSSLASLFKDKQLAIWPDETGKRR